jgi:hypothetical protein
MTDRVDERSEGRARVLESAKAEPVTEDCDWARFVRDLKNVPASSTRLGVLDRSRVDQVFHNWIRLAPRHNRHRANGL